MAFPIPFANASLDALQSVTPTSGSDSGDIIGGSTDFGNVNIQGISRGLSVPQSPIVLVIIGVVILGIFFLRR